MRGKAMFFTAPAMLPRITPAYAGKRLLEALETIRNQDHPRVCGEKSSTEKRLVRLMGSPPRMRGKVFFLAF